MKVLRIANDLLFKNHRNTFLKQPPKELIRERLKPFLRRSILKVIRMTQLVYNQSCHRVPTAPVKLNDFFNSKED